jgi:CBS domain-containing protein
MTSPAVTVDEESSVAEIARILKQKSINRVPVLDAGGRLVGIVSRADILGLP